MIIAAPISEYVGLDSPLYPHFGSASAFVLADLVEDTIVRVDNQDCKHAHGMCQAMKALAGHRVDAVIVSGIGQGALRGLQAAGVRVLSTEKPTFREALAQWKDDGLCEVSLDDACEGHAEGHDCGHH